MPSYELNRQEVTLIEFRRVGGDGVNLVDCVCRADIAPRAEIAAAQTDVEHAALPNAHPSRLAEGGRGGRLAGR
jgi:hypothetical protein